MNRSDYSYGSMSHSKYHGLINQGSMSHSKYHGLINQGSTCYLNSVLQVLFMTKEFREAVERYPCDSKSLDSHLKDLFNELNSDTASTTKLTGVLGISREFLQSDAAEWFENILSKMSNHEASQLFQGKQTTKTKCIRCTIETETEDPFWSLPLDMEDIHDIYDVSTGFENYFKESKLSGENQLYCEECSTKSDTTMKVEINHHPEVLTLLLKRFKYDYRFRKHVKVNRRVKIPARLRIPSYGEMASTYQLYAYVEHSGELRNGHYIVTIKDQDDVWYVFNDHSVSKPSSYERCEMSREAYLLFYRKISATVADNSSTSTSGCPRSDQPCRIDRETKEGQKGENDHFVTNSDKQQYAISKPSKSLEIDRDVKISGESYKICEIMINGKNEKYILLKEICQESRGDYSIQHKCHNTDCEINKLSFDHTHLLEEPCITPTGLKRKHTKMHTGGPSESYKGGSERSQETRPENQPGQIITVIQCPSNQNQMANSIQSGTANKSFENQDAGSEHNYLTSQSSRDTTHFVEVGGGAGGDLQQPLGPQCPGSSEGLTSRFQGLTLNYSSEPDKAGDQRVSTKSGTCTGNQQFIDSDNRENANS